ncbi:predicted protein [Naegleria gruberi]|uniref:Predicted protein n=1 Tax=Naegleria gruberi TaxID=5762 RepID=D2VRB8_NAEGR|nr:uncharacterized protein NAEGRDRAFT_51638 [Naegleria gruberi]EFC40580.1 predicted protein [Naegleria gruberi]|eukprot:XP_002673324.1 predicted protein [Naegleria gruberi strain NEG-M]
MNESKSKPVSKLGDFLKKQLETDQLQLQLMKILYSNCYKIHMEKKLQKKAPQKSNIIIKMTEQERGLKDFLEIVDECTENQAWFPQQTVSKYLDIGEEGWTIMSHWMLPIFKVSNSGLELGCETCGKLQCISQAFEQFLTKRNEFEMDNQTALHPFEKFVDIWSQPKLRSMHNTIYKLADHPSANAFTKGFSNCTMTYFVFSRELQGADPKKHQTLVAVLEALTLNSSIYSIDVSNLLLIHDAAVKALCNMIRKKKNLKRIVISDLSLGKSSYSLDIINAVLEAPLLQEISIYIYEELDSNFRFLEGAPASLVYKLGNHPFKNFTFSLLNFNFPIQSLSILEGMLKNRNLKYIEFKVENNDEYKKYQYIDYVNKMGNLIGSIDEFHFQTCHIPNISLNQNLHLLKKCTNPKKRQYFIENDLLKAIINDELYSSVGSEFNLNSDLMREFGFSHVSHFCKFITKLELDLKTDLNENEWELICSAVIESETLEELRVRNVNVLQKNNHSIFQN